MAIDDPFCLARLRQMAAEEPSSGLSATHVSHGRWHIRKSTYPRPSFSIRPQFNPYIDYRYSNVTNSKLSTLDMAPQVVSDTYSPDIVPIKLVAFQNFWLTSSDNQNRERLSK